MERRHSGAEVIGKEGRKVEVMNMKMGEAKCKPNAMSVETEKSNADCKERRKFLEKRK